VKRQFRLTRSTDFKRVRRLGKSYAHPLVVLVVMRNPAGELHVGFTASRTVGGAVQRNLVRRRLKACFDELMPQLRPGWDLVVVARQPIIAAEYSTIRSGVTRLLEQAGLIVER
jgi:ribonuclease P protein component